MNDARQLCRDLFNSEQDKLLAILTISDHDILTDDFQDDRRINYHIGPITESWLRSRIYYTASTQQEKAVYDQPVISLLQFLDPNMLITLEHIFFVRDETDIDEICTLVGAEPCEFPSAIDFDEPETLGCFWHQYSSVIIHMAAIDKTVQEMKTEYDHDGMYFNTATETDIGVFTTLTHEIRHLGLSNPYLDEQEYPRTEETEQAVEAWAIETYEQWQLQRSNHHSPAAS